MIALLLAAFLIPLTWACAKTFAKPPKDGVTTCYILTEFSYETHLAVFVMLALVALATQLHNLWLALIVAWIALNVPLGTLAWLRGWLPETASTNVRASTQMVFGMGVVVLEIVSRTLHPARDLPWWAVAVLLYAAFNGYVFLYQRTHEGHSPPWVDVHKIVRTGTPDLGVCDDSTQFGWLMAMAALTAAYLSGAWHPAVLLLAPGFCLLLYWSRSRAAMGGFLVGALTTAALWNATVGGILVATAAPLAVVGWRAKRFGVNSWLLRKPDWLRAVSLLHRSRYLGYGMGVWENHKIQVRPEGTRQHEWIALHNDWLQAAVEVGLFPVLCALGYLGTAWWSLPATPEAAYGFSLLMFTAAWACLYYPLRVPAQALVLVLGVAVLEAHP